MLAEVEVTKGGASGLSGLALDFQGDEAIIAALQVRGPEDVADDEVPAEHLDQQVPALLLLLPDPLLLFGARRWVFDLVLPRFAVLVVEGFFVRQHGRLVDQEVFFFRGFVVHEGDEVLARRVARRFPRVRPLRDAVGAVARCLQRLRGYRARVDEDLVVRAALAAAGVAGLEHADFAEGFVVFVVAWGRGDHFYDDDALLLTPAVAGYEPEGADGRVPAREHVALEPRLAVFDDGEGEAPVVFGDFVRVDDWGGDCFLLSGAVNDGG